MAPKITVTGLRATGQYLNVSISIEQAASLRFAVVKVPLQMLLADDVVAALDTAHRRTLIEAWSGVDICDPLF